MSFQSFRAASMGPRTGDEVFGEEDGSSSSSGSPPPAKRRHAPPPSGGPGAPKLLPCHSLGVHGEHSMRSTTPPASPTDEPDVTVMCFEARTLGTHFLKTTTWATRFELIVTDGRDAWSIDATEEDVGEWARRHSISVDAFMKHVKERLSTPEDPKLHLTYDEAGEKWLEMSAPPHQDGRPRRTTWRFVLDGSYDSRSLTLDVLGYYADAFDSLLDNFKKFTEHTTKEAAIREDKLGWCEVQMARMEKKMARLQAKLEEKEDELIDFREMYADSPKRTP